MNEIEELYSSETLYQNVILYPIKRPSSNKILMFYI